MVPLLNSHVQASSQYPSEEARALEDRYGDYHIRGVFDQLICAKGADWFLATCRNPFPNAPVINEFVKVRCMTA